MGCAMAWCVAGPGGFSGQAASPSAKKQSKTKQCRTLEAIRFQRPERPRKKEKQSKVGAIVHASLRQHPWQLPESVPDCILPTCCCTGLQRPFFLKKEKTVCLQGASKKTAAVAAVLGYFSKSFTAVMAAEAHCSSRCPPGAPATPTAPITSLPTATGRPPPSSR